MKIHLRYYPTVKEYKRTGLTTINSTIGVEIHKGDSLSSTTLVSLRPKASSLKEVGIWNDRIDNGDYDSEANLIKEVCFRITENRKKPAPGWVYSSAIKFNRLKLSELSWGSIYFLLSSIVDDQEKETNNLNLQDEYLGLWMKIDSVTGINNGLKKFRTFQIRDYNSKFFINHPSFLVKMIYKTIQDCEFEEGSVLNDFCNQAEEFILLYDAIEEFEEDSSREQCCYFALTQNEELKMKLFEFLDSKNFPFQYMISLQFALINHPLHRKFVKYDNTIMTRFLSKN